jgi:hypothetical protein
LNWGLYRFILFTVTLVRLIMYAVLGHLLLRKVTCCAASISGTPSTVMMRKPARGARLRSVVRRAYLKGCRGVSLSSHWSCSV